MIDNQTILRASIQSGAADPVDPISDLSRGVLGQPAQSRSVDWFLPENSSALREITSPDSTGPGLTDVDAIADRILSHIRA